MVTILLLWSVVMLSGGALARWRLGRCLQNPAETSTLLYVRLLPAASQYGCTVIFRPGPPLSAGFVSGEKCLVLPELPVHRCQPAPSQVDLAIIVHELGHARQLYEVSRLWRIWQYLATWGQLGAIVGRPALLVALCFPSLAASFWVPVTITAWAVAQICTLVRVSLEWDASHKGLQLLRQEDYLSEMPACGKQLEHMLRLAALTYLLWPISMDEFWHELLSRIAMAVAGDPAVADTCAVAEKS
ncbi:MAG: hypothetical protein EXR62_06880 [Chloroflexi bacterium]|nr:hypothetical protein [Chloroflexota bacterium]